MVLLSILRILLLWGLVLFMEQGVQTTQVGQASDAPLLSLIQELLEEAPGKRQRKPQVLGHPLWCTPELYQHSADASEHLGENFSTGASMCGLLS